MYFEGNNTREISLTATRSYETGTKKLYNSIFKSQEEKKCQNKVNYKRS